MFTTADKAWTALLGAIIYFLQLWLKIDLSFITADMIQNAIPVLTPLFVWLVPNKKPPTA